MATVMAGVEITCPKCGETVSRELFSGGPRFTYCKCGAVGTDGFLYVVNKQALAAQKILTF